MAVEKYEDNFYYLQDVILYAKVSLMKYYSIRINKYNDNTYSFKDTVLFPEDVENILLKDFNEEELILYQEAIRDIDAFREQIIEKSMESLHRGIFIPLAYLTVVFELSDFNIHCLWLSLAAEMDKNLGRAYGFMLDNLESTRPDMDLCIKLFVFTSYDRIQSLAVTQLSGDSLGMLLTNTHSPKNFLSAEIKIEPRIVKYALGQLVLDSDQYADAGIHFFSYEEHVKECWCGQETEQALARLYHNTATPLIAQLYGAKGSGKKLHIKRFAKSTKTSVLFVEVGTLYNQSANDKSRLQRLLCETILQQAMVCFTGLDVLLERDNHSHFWDWLLYLIEKLCKYTRCIFFTTQNEWKLSGYMREMPIANIEVALPNASTRLEIWKSLADGCPEGLLQGIANKYSLTPGQMEAAYKNAAVQCTQSGIEKITDKALSAACQRQLLHKLEKYAAYVPTVYSWEDLILPSEPLDLLWRAVNYVKYKSFVFEEWDFASKLAYGRGLTLLLSGAPGTGKTMTAQVVARELGLELYKVDLSCVLSKYIGETEQNLRRIFDEASKGQCALLFDEADALFGKRTEIKSSHDRNANLEVSYLLQAVEDYDGIVILSTNYLANIDPAFKRRIQFVIEFTSPDVAHRKMLWQSMFPEKAPVGEIDFDFLASRFELTGSSIKTVVISAAYDAASKGEKISVAHILASLRIELTKQGKVVMESDFKEANSAERV